MRVKGLGTKSVARRRAYNGKVARMVQCYEEKVEGEMNTSSVEKEVESH